MIVKIGNRYPRLFFSDEGEPFYFKEDVILPEEIPEKPDDIVGTLSEDIKKDIFIYCERKTVNIEANRRVSDRILATVRLAEVFGISNIVAGAKRGELGYEGQHIKGVMIPPIKGANIKVLDILPDLEGYRMGYTVTAVRQLTQLLLFDFICGQVDRHSRNIRLDTDIDFSDIRPPADGRPWFWVKGICGIDHDMSFGRTSYDDIKKKVSKGLCISPELFGEMQYTAVDEVLCDKILGMSEAEYRDALSEYLSEEELFFFFDRIEGLRRIVDRERERDEAAIARGEEFFSRFVSSDSDYADYLNYMEVAAGEQSVKRNLRFSYHPSYLKKKILLHIPLMGGRTC